MPAGKMERLVQKARELREQGKPLRDIAREVGVSVATASAYCRGVLPKWKNAEDERKRRFSEQFRSMYSEGKSIPAIADQLAIPASTLYDWRRELGIERSSRKRYVTESLRGRIAAKLSSDPDGTMRQEAIRLYMEQQLSTPEIGQLLGKSPTAIGDWLTSAGISMRRKPTARTRRKLSEANRGEKRPNWKGGITPENVRQRTSLLMRLAREQCFERDDYTCRLCGSRGRKLNAHHVWPFHRFPSLKYDVNNLITLCKRCHDSFHKAAGGHVKLAIGPFFSRHNPV